MQGIAPRGPLTRTCRALTSMSTPEGIVRKREAITCFMMVAQLCPTTPIPQWDLGAAGGALNTSSTPRGLARDRIEARSLAEFQRPCARRLEQSQWLCRLLV